ncbi:MAG: hypothetical protein HC780_04950 [Leptolyngbyaceae cyanobacterium CSU_1_3]|nr:hypothetical protein [Leptolyngbyaceae cyanobacterium CSU_1_3]
MKTHIFIKSKSYLYRAFQIFLEPARQWLFNTPERALDHAYGAALLIKSLENEYTRGSKTQGFQPIVAILRRLLLKKILENF